MTREEKLEEAKRLYQTANADQKYVLESLFPELVESEDEKIRKALLEYFGEECDTATINGIYCYKICAWLEKKGEQKSIGDIKPKFNVGDTMRTLQEANNGYTDGMPVVVSIDNEYYHCTNELIAIKDQDNYEFPPINVKQKLADKVEPKFHEGDWVVKGCNILKIRCVGDEYYCYETVGGYVDNMLVSEIDSSYHLWTINDAKDGDVLISENDYPFIYAGNHIYTKYLTAYCGITNDGEFKISDKTELWTNDNVEPSTKKERDLLFQKMRKAGYEWDEEKKEVKIIEWNNIVRDSIFDEDIDIPFGAIDSELYYQEIHIPDGFQATIEGNKIILKKEE